MLMFPVLHKCVLIEEEIWTNPWVRENLPRVHCMKGKGTNIAKDIKQMRKQIAFVKRYFNVAIIFHLLAERISANESDFMTFAS